MCSRRDSFRRRWNASQPTALAEYGVSGTLAIVVDIGGGGEGMLPETSPAEASHGTVGHAFAGALNQALGKGHADIVPEGGGRHLLAEQRMVVAMLDGARDGTTRP